jgi:hypothetical protein
MNREHYERAKERIENERRRAVELIEMAFDTQLRALELVWMNRGEGPSILPAALAEPAEPPAAVPPPAPAPDPPAPRISFEDLLLRVEERLDRLPDPFDRNDVCAVLELTPDRNALSRCLTILKQQGLIQVHQPGVGRRPILYRKRPHSET